MTRRGRVASHSESVSASGGVELELTKMSSSVESLGASVWQLESGVAWRWRVPCWLEGLKWLVEGVEAAWDLKRDDFCVKLYRTRGSLCEQFRRG